MLNIDISGISNVVDPSKIDREGAIKALQTLKNRTGEGSDFTGWLDLPYSYDNEEYARVKETAAEIRENADVFIIIGIGGSYLGSRMAIELIRSIRFNETKKPLIYFAGNGISGDATAELLELIEGKSVYVNVISKSGTTLEPALAFRIFRDYINRHYSAEEAKKRIICTTDKARGVLKGIADAEGYRTFVIPDDVGGRYSVFTPVGLLPLAVSGIDIDEVMKSSKAAMDEMLKEDLDNKAVTYAAARRVLYDAGKTVEILSYPGERAHFFAEWWKQLYGESEGKGGKGIYPTSCQITADLHSLGQYIQQGLRILQETMLVFDCCSKTIKLPHLDSNDDGLAYTEKFTYSDILKGAFEGTKQAHISGGVPVITITTDKIDETVLGELVVFFETACGISGYMQGCNPFDQPGVEEYKKNMFAILGRDK